MGEKRREWENSILALHDVGSYACSAACPCIIMNEISRMLVESKGHNDTHTCVASCVSFMVDIPCVFCIGNSRERVIRNFYHPSSKHDHHNHNNSKEGWWDHDYHNDYDNDDSGGGGDEKKEDEWDSENSSFDWWPYDWCKFYTMGALESCCGWLCIGPNVSGANFPLCFSCMAGSIYPCCVCPLSCLLRRLAIHKLKIDTEGVLYTCAVSTLCTPCSLIQIREELQSFQNSSDHHSSRPHTTNSMMMMAADDMYAVD